MRYPVSADPENLDPWTSVTVATQRVITNIYEGLTTLDPETAEVIPELAESWDISDDAPQVTFQDMMKQIGVTVDLEKEDNSSYWSHVGEPDVKLFLSGWSADFTDPSEIFNFLFAQGRDDTKYDNPEVNALLEEATALSDESERNAIYEQVHQIIMTDAPWIVSSYSKVSYLKKPSVVDFIVSPAGTYRTPLKYVSLER